MATSPDHPELTFVQASGYTKGRPDGPPLWIVIHDMEAGESSTRAESTAAYFATGAGGRSVSSHYCADDDSVIQCVRLADVAWTVGNRPGNNRGINWELSGYARQTREQWLDPFGLAMFRQMAPYVRADAAEYGIPLRRCTVADLKAFRPGVTSHNDLRLAFGVTTHTDPGPNFPWDVFFQILEEGDMVTDAEIAKIAKASAQAVHNQRLGASDVTFAVAVQDTDRNVKALVARPASPPAVVDQAMLKAELMDPEFLAAVAKAVNDDAHRRSAE
jgi:N-acetyl-anhydromuramyl-L-alanine amidase AmpD